LNELESKSVNFERCTYLARIQPESGYLNLKEEEEMLRAGRFPTSTQNSWPSKGQLMINDLKVKYRPKLKFVLNGVSFTVPGWKKIGVVGRTGAGKSSLILSV